jgi:hypothetical protein
MELKEAKHILEIHEIALMKAKLEAEKANSAKSEFLGKKI